MICVHPQCTGRHSTSHGLSNAAICPRARRRKSANDRKAKRIKRGAEVYEELENEVKVVPGRCVSWNCYNPAPDGPECAEHSAEPLPVKNDPHRAAARRQKRIDDPEWAAEERRKRRANRRKATPAAREAENERKREKTRAARIAAGFEPGVRLATARKQKRHADILALLRERGFVAVGELAKLFDRDPKRIADDLRQLDEEGLAIRVHGGARLRSESTSSPRGAAKELGGTKFCSNHQETAA